MIIKRVDPELLKEAFDESGKSYATVAAEIFRSEMTVRRYVNGLSRVPDTAVEPLARSVHRRPVDLYVVPDEPVATQRQESVIATAKPTSS
jgi:hypothetical protein